MIFYQHEWLFKGENLFLMDFRASCCIIVLLIPRHLRFPWCILCVTFCMYIVALKECGGPVRLMDSLTLGLNVERKQKTRDYVLVTTVNRRKENKKLRRP